MKTAISLPDDTFERATSRASALGMSRSEFFARAATHYLAELDAQPLTEQINAALEQIGEVDETGRLAVESSHQFLLRASGEW